MDESPAPAAPASKWPPALAWPGLVMLWLVALAIVGLGAAILFFGLERIGSGEIPAAKSLGLLKGMAIWIVAVGFMAAMAWKATRGSLYAYVIYIFLMVFSAGVAAVTKGHAGYWILTGALTGVIGMGLPSYVRWSRRREAEDAARDELRRKAFGKRDRRKPTRPPA